MKATFRGTTGANIQDPQTVTSETPSHGESEQKDGLKKYMRCKQRERQLSRERERGGGEKERKSRCVFACGGASRAQCMALTHWCTVFMFHQSSS